MVYTLVPISAQIGYQNASYNDFYFQLSPMLLKMNSGI